MLRDDKGNLIWRPTLKQERFLQIPLSVKEAFYAGAVNAGKSDVLLMYPIVWGWHKHPQFKGIFFRRTMTELRNEIIPRSRDYFEPLGASYNASYGIWTFPSGALYFMAHCEEEKHVHNYDSMQPNYAAFDELTSFTEWIYLYITVERVRVNEYLKDELPMIVRSGSNPGNIGHQFVYKRFIKPYPAGGQILKGKGGMKRVFIPATVDDNPYASKQYKDELETLPEAEKKAKKYGDWTSYEGQVFDELREKHYPGEPENALHLIPKFEIPVYWPKVVSIDWGFAAMCSVGYGAITPNKRVIIYRHQIFYGLKIEDWGPQVAFYTDNEEPYDVIVCHSAEQHRGDPKTIREQISDALGREVSLGDKNRVGGKMLVHEYLRWKPKPVFRQEIEKFDPEYAEKLYRMKGPKAYNQYMSSFQEPKTEDNLPKLQFFDDDPDIKEIISSIKACVYEKSDKSGKKKEDVAEFHGDDPYDMLRIMLSVVDNYFETATYEQNKVNKIQQVLEQLKSTADMTAFYRNMRLAEKQSDLMKPVQRFKNSGQKFHYRVRTRH